MGSQRCPVPAIRYSRVEFLFEAFGKCYCFGYAVLKAGSVTAEHCEFRQVREEAAVSGQFRVLMGYLVGAG